MEHKEYEFSHGGIHEYVKEYVESLPDLTGKVVVDFLVCQEGIEHISDKVGVFREFNRVLRKGGTLVFTIPSISHTRGRLSWFLVESDLWKRSAPNEMDSVWFSEGESDRLYFGHLFLYSGSCGRTRKCRKRWPISRR